MRDTSFLVNGRAMPKMDRAAVMRRAWAVFRETYRYPEITFKDIGRKCFAWALRKAWEAYRNEIRQLQSA